MISLWVIAIVVCIAFLLRRRYTYWTRHGVKGANYIELIWNPFKPHHLITRDSFLKYGKIYGGYSFFGKYIVVNEPDLIRDIVVKNFHIFPDHAHVNKGTSAVRLNLFFLPGNEDWKRVRSIISPAFTSGKLKAMMSHISGISDQLIDNLNELEKRGSAVDMREHVGAFAMDVIAACAYGIKTDSLNNPDHPLVVNAKKMFGLDATIPIILSILAPPIARFFKMELFDLDAVNYFDKLTNEIVAQRKRLNHEINRDNKSQKKTDFLQLIIDSNKSNKDLGYDSSSDVDVNPDEPTHDTKRPIGTLSPEELTAQGILFFIAGYDTTSAAISHAIYYLGKDVKSQNTLYNELQTVDEFSYDNLSRLKFLNAVIHETLRLSPSLSRVQRECIQDYKLGDTGILIPKGTLVDFCPYALHRDPEFWPEPELFKPERFLEPTHHPYAYIPFGGGQRLCTGQRFAMNEMRMCLAKMFNRFEFTLAPAFKLEYFNGSLLNSPKKVLVNIKSRKH